MKAPKKIIQQICREWSKVGSAACGPLPGIGFGEIACLAGDSPARGASVSTCRNDARGIVLEIACDREGLFRDACAFVLDVLLRHGYCHMASWREETLEEGCSGRFAVRMEAMDADSLPDGLDLLVDPAEVAGAMRSAAPGAALEGRAASLEFHGKRAELAEDRGMLRVENGREGIEAVKELFGESERCILNAPMLEHTGYVFAAMIRKPDR